MELRKACKSAYDLLQEDGFIGFYRVIDIGYGWVFFGGNPKEVYYGVRTVIVNKETDTCEWFAAQDIDNEKLIDNGNIVIFQTNINTKHYREHYGAFFV